MFETPQLKLIFTEPNRLALIGRVDDTFPAEAAKNLSALLLHISLKEVTAINSGGVLQLIRFLNNLHPSQTVHFEEAPTIVVIQMSLVRGLINSRFQLKSFFVPYFDKEKDEQLMLRLTIDEVKDFKIPYKRHPETGSMLEPDVNPERLLNFLNFGEK